MIACEAVTNEVAADEVVAYEVVAVTNEVVSEVGECEAANAYEVVIETNKLDLSYFIYDTDL